SLAASGRNVSLGTSTRTGTIINDDNATVTLSGGTTKNEGNTGTTPYVFTLTLNAAIPGGFTANYTTNDGTATTADNDYVDNDGALAFTGTAGETKTFTVLVNGDLNIEANETFQTAINSLSGLANPGAVTILGSPQTSTITNDEQDWGDAPTAAQSGFVIRYPTTADANGARHALALGGLRLGATVDAEVDGQPNATATGDDGDEDGVTLPAVLVRGTNATITVNVSAACKLDAWVDFGRDGRWSQDTLDYIFASVNLVAGDNTLSFAVPAVASLGTSFARFRVSTTGGLTSRNLATDGEVEDYQVNISSVALSVNDVTLNEGNAGMSSFTFTASLSSPAGPGGVTFDIATQDNTATAANNDYIPKSLVGQTIPAGSSTYSFTVLVNGDLVVENNESFFVNVTNVTGAGVTDGQGLGTITNDDAATLTLAGGITQNEGNAGTTAYTFTATLNNQVQGGFTVPYSTNDGTATTADNDYTDNDGILTFAGTAGETKTITVLVNGDTKVELDETFTVALGALTGAPAGVTTVGSPQTGTITNDDATTVAIAANVSQAESVTPQTFTVTLSNPVDVNVTVQFSTSDGTATTADNDYTGIVNQTVTFAAGTTTAQAVNVMIINDPKVEANETYTGTISGLAAGGRNVSLANATRTGTIQNDDATNLFIAGPVTHDEGNSGTTNYLFSISLTAPVQGGFTVN
ncbi:MAG: Calx-beta domain-containing protein, partial [Saprospiraceae bacterium]